MALGTTLEKLPLLKLPWGEMALGTTLVKLPLL
jgi:hypothetical protein